MLIYVKFIVNCVEEAVFAWRNHSDISYLLRNCNQSRLVFLKIEVDIH